MGHGSPSVILLVISRGLHRSFRSELVCELPEAPQHADLTVNSLASLDFLKASISEKQRRLCKATERLLIL